MENTEERELTFGEKAVGLTFNPSKDSDVGGMVHRIKEDCAKAIDTMNMYRHNTEDGEKKRMLSVAITELQTAQMWAVKAVTWSN